ncbi:hypothetical protein T12_9670 [Trichinella patagoniensis]|uniref:Uncharacterized protein n=1 Tax=Trichinella patagoniensis TaxID=990121 RepID=A0A0V0Z544_9BILA|nr:hypothetical protein T12_9670 [Trichinella patagoniensis]
MPSSVKIRRVQNCGELYLWRLRLALKADMSKMFFQSACMNKTEMSADIFGGDGIENSDEAGAFNLAKCASYHHAVLQA